MARGSLPQACNLAELDALSQRSPRMKQPPPPPDGLDTIGQTEWTRVVGLLVERGHWDPLRSTVLLAYCESYADWHRLTAQVRGKEVVLQGATRTVDAQGHVTTAGGKASPNPLLPVIDRAHRSLQSHSLVAVRV